MAFKNQQCYEVHLVTISYRPDLHVKIISENSTDYLVECLQRMPHCFEKIGSRDIKGKMFVNGITKESALNTDDVITQLNKDYYANADVVFDVNDTIVDEGIKWYVNREVFQHYYLPCKTHKKNMYLRLEEMLINLCQ